MSDEAKMAEAVASMSALMEPVLDAVEGHRVRCVAAGYDDTTSRLMAAEYHGVLLSMIVSGLTQKPETS